LLKCLAFAHVGWLFDAAEQTPQRQYAPDMNVTVTDNHKATGRSG